MTASGLAGVESVAYLESQRALNQQQQSLDELRSRTGILLAAAAITSSFLGGQALRTEPLEAIGAAAVVSFAIAVGAALLVLWPGRDAWTFVVSAKILLEDWAGRETAELEAFLAEKLEEYWERNRGRLNRLYIYFQIAAIGVAGEVVLWTIQISNS